MKKLIIYLLMFIPLQILTGQDKIITIQQDTINCKIISISNNNILYEQKENGLLIGKFIPTDQVLEFLRSSSGILGNPYRKAGQKTKPELPWMISINPGRSIMLASTTDEENLLIRLGAHRSKTNDYYKQLKNGWNISGDIYYLTSDNFGVGVKYSLFANSAEQDFIVFRYVFLDFDAFYQNPILLDYMFTTMEYNKKTYIHYAAPSLIFRQWLDESKKFQLIETLSVGFVHYRCEERTKVDYNHSNYLVESNTWGTDIGLSAGYYPLQWLSVGMNIDFMFAYLTKMNITYINHSYEKNLADKDYEYLTRFDYSLNIRFHF